MTADEGMGIAGTKSPRMGFPGVGFGGVEGRRSGGCGSEGYRTPREIPPRGYQKGEVGPLIGHRLGDSGVGLAPLLPAIRTRTQFVLTTRSLIGPPTRSG